MFLSFKHDLLMVSINLSDIAILNIKSSDCHCINEPIKLLQNVDLTEISGTLSIKKIYKFS